MKVKAVIAYVGPISFPDGGAAARRVLGNAKTIHECGYKVIMGSGQVTKPGETNVFNYEGIEVHSLNERTAEHLPSILKNLSYLTIGKKTVAWLDAMSQKPAAVILYSGYSPYFLRLLPWCKKNNVPLVFDAVEWYQASSKIKGYLSPYHWNIEWAMRKLSIKAKNVISISSYLDNYYRSRHCISIIIPPTIDSKKFEPALGRSKNKKLTIAYTGTPGHKDLFDNYLEAVLNIDPSGEKVVLKIAGLSNDQVLQYPALKTRGINVLPPCIESVGNVSHAEAIQLVKNADFSVLLREKNRVATAGFPTKVVESLTVGTPVICNLTSDLAAYISDGVEGLVCKDFTADSLTESIKKALKLSGDEMAMMRIAARKQAESSFDFRNYITKMNDFLNKITGKEVEGIKIHKNV